MSNNGSEAIKYYRSKGRSINLETRPARPAEGARELNKGGTSVVDEGHLSLVYLFEGGL
ncbi:hypothetical protein [Alteromonas hispanica]|uniref:Uncharacterized protein n=1 Tax=Alteromonas hispanica TaxID=315421 RepID=A0A6L9MVI7_9ALTE|nr:hypothetical protein [Alteromonas hispanica]NDW22146.1 hypothetical protein [Alteromonas hispanica]